MSLHQYGARDRALQTYGSLFQPAYVTWTAESRMYILRHSLATGRYIIIPVERSIKGTGPGQKFTMAERKCTCKNKKRVTREREEDTAVGNNDLYFQFRGSFLVLMHCESRAAVKKLVR